MSSVALYEEVQQYHVLGATLYELENHSYCKDVRTDDNVRKIMKIKRSLSSSIQSQHHLNKSITNVIKNCIQ